MVVKTAKYLMDLRHFLSLEINSMNKILITESGQAAELYTDVATGDQNKLRAMNISLDHSTPGLSQSITPSPSSLQDLQ